MLKNTISYTNERNGFTLVYVAIPSTLFFLRPLSFESVWKGKTHYHLSFSVTLETVVKLTPILSSRFRNMFRNKDRVLQSILWVWGLKFNLNISSYSLNCAYTSSRLMPKSIHSSFSLFQPHPNHSQFTNGFKFFKIAEVRWFEIKENGIAEIESIKI